MDYWVQVRDEDDGLTPTVTKTLFVHPHKKRTSVGEVETHCDPLESEKVGNHIPGYRESGLNRSSRREGTRFPGGVKKRVGFEKILLSLILIDEGNIFVRSKLLVRHQMGVPGFPVECFIKL